MTLPDGAPPEAVQPGDADMKEAGMPLDPGLEMDLWNSFTARVSGAATSFTGGEQSTAPSSEQHPDSPEPKYRKRDGKGGGKLKIVTGKVRSTTARDTAAREGRMVDAGPRRHGMTRAGPAPEGRIPIQGS